MTIKNIEAAQMTRHITRRQLRRENLMVYSFFIVVFLIVALVISFANAGLIKEQEDCEARGGQIVGYWILLIPAKDCMKDGRILRPNKP